MSFTKGKKFAIGVLIPIILLYGWLASISIYTIYEWDHKLSFNIMILIIVLDILLALLCIKIVISLIRGINNESPQPLNKIDSILLILGLMMFLLMFMSNIFILINYLVRETTITNQMWITIWSYFSHDLVGFLLIVMNLFLQTLKDLSICKRKSNSNEEIERLV